MIPESPQWIVSQAGREGFALSFGQAERLFTYQELLLQWAGRVSLIGPAAKARFWEDHLLEALWLDSLIQTTASKEKRIADIGSGAGIPGLVLACLDPARRVHLFESRERKARFLELAARQLDLDRTETINQRIGTKNRWPGEGYPIIVSRAAARIEELVGLAGVLAAPEARLFALVGREALDSTPETFIGGGGPGWVTQERQKRRGHGKTRGLLILERQG